MKRTHTSLIYTLPLCKLLHSRQLDRVLTETFSNLQDVEGHQGIRHGWSYGSSQGKKKKGMAATADHAPQSTHTQATSFVVDLAMDKGH